MRCVIYQRLKLSKINLSIFVQNFLVYNYVYHFTNNTSTVFVALNFSNLTFHS